jgi:hypothetical protein
MCAGVPRIFTSGPLDSKLRPNGFWLFRFRPRPRRFCCPCLTALMAPMLLEPVPSIPVPARACTVLLAPGLGIDRDIRKIPYSRPGIGPSDVTTQPPSELRPTRRLRRQRRQSGHSLCFSWTVSGADDRSPCCEQYNLLRTGPYIRSSPPLVIAATADAWTIPLADNLSRMPAESKGFLSLCSIPCSGSNTAPPIAGIVIEPYVLRIDRRCYAG